VAAVFASLAAILAGCSGDAGSSAERYIVDELQEEIGLGPLEPVCAQPAKREAGETFDCTATAEDGRVVTFVGEMTDEDTFDISTTNLISVAGVGVVRSRLAEVIAANIQSAVSPDDIVCGEGVVLLDDAGAFTCRITDRVSGNTFEMVIETGGIDDEGTLRKLDFEIGTEPVAP
jgi:hypothetical protein